MSSFRSEFDQILIKWGHNIYLQRVRDRFSGENFVYENTFERHTVRHISASSLQNAQKENVEGIVFDSSMIYYMRYDSHPMPGDRIYENIEYYPNNTVTYLIESAVPMRGENGQISYWSVGATKESPA